MKRFVAATAIAGFISVGLATPAFGATPAGQSPGNPSGTGNATQSCQSIVFFSVLEPGHASSLPGSPFNEPSATSSGGNGGSHYARERAFHCGQDDKWCRPYDQMAA